MGTCLSTKKNRNHEPLPFINQERIKEMPAVFIQENFKIVDYTQVLKDIKDISDVELFFSSYRPTDVRCVKGKNEGKQEHSHLLIVFSQNLHGDISREIGLITDYSPYGFAISIGDMNQIKEICNLKNSHLENLHLPKQENQEKLTVSEVLEWAFEHKDEQYLSPLNTPEVNMGKRIFKFVTEKLSEKRFFKERA